MVKYFLFFNINDIFNHITPFSILEITKRKKIIFDYLNFNNYNINQLNYINLLDFSTENTKRFIEALKKSYNPTLTKLPEREFIKLEFIKKLHTLFIDKYSFLFVQKNIYHPVQTQKKNISNIKCSFYSKFPKLCFKIIKKYHHLKLEILIEIDNRKYYLEEFKRIEFFLELNNVYYLLSKQDYNQIKQILKVNFKELSVDEFIQKYYVNLSKKYEVETSIFKEEIIKIEPIPEIYISELGGNFLMFNPRWNYDGNILDDNKDVFYIYKGLIKYKYLRNKNFENETIKLLQNAHPNFINKNSFYLNFKDASKKNWFFNFYYNTLKDNYNLIGMDMLSYFRYSDYPINTSFEIIDTIDNEVTAKFEVKFGKEKIHLKVLQKAINEEKNFILLKDNSLGVLPEEWITEYSNILKYGTILTKDNIRFAKWLLILSQQLIYNKNYLELILPENWMNKWEAWNKNEYIYDIPKNIKTELREYQHKGYEWMNLMSEINAGTLLADDMGLGKTIQTISTISYNIEANPNSKILIICPASLIYNWSEEFAKFNPDTKIFIYHGNNRNFNKYLSSNNQIIITSYATIRNDIDFFCETIWDMIILDESHNIKNIKTKQTQAILRLLGIKRILLNGTPIMNNVFDLYPQLKFILPQLFRSEKIFKNEFEIKIGDKNIDKKLSKLRKLTNPFILRRTKELVAKDLPNKVESVLWCEMADDQKKAYELVKKNIKKNVYISIKENGFNNAKILVLESILKLRQMCSLPKLVNNEDFNFSDISSVKITTLIDELKNNLSENKVIVFSQFIETMTELKNQFDKNNISYLSFDGKTDIKKRKELVNEYQSKDSKIQVFLISLMAGNTGITLTAANYVFLVEPWWNKAVQQQAIDRVHRIGQTQHVFAYSMICKNTIEERIFQLQNDKQYISEEVIGVDEGFVKNLSQEDIEFLFD